jgi:hypothetical protein
MSTPFLFKKGSAGPLIKPENSLSPCPGIAQETNYDHLFEMINAISFGNRMGVKNVKRIILNYLLKAFLQSYKVG